MAEDAEPDELDAAAAVYRGPLEEFVARRDALARELRAAGQRDDANRVKKLRKPTRTAWALDAAVHRDPASVERVATAVATMVAAQSGRGDVRSASEQLRVAVRQLAADAAGAAADGGHPVDRTSLVPAVMAVVTDPQAFVALRAGRLTDIPSPGELGLLAETPPGAQPSYGAGRAEPVAAETTAPTGVARQGRSAEAETTRTEADVREARRRETTARETRQRAEAEARRALEQAEAEAEAARERAAAAERAVHDGEAALEDANERLRHAENDVRTARETLRQAQRTAKDVRQQVRQADRAASTARAELDALRR